jgi:putative acetyltransferase
VSIYIPASETYVYEQDLKVVGCYAFYESNLAAIVVAPDYQDNGIGKQLMVHAKNKELR